MTVRLAPTRVPGFVSLTFANPPANVLTLELIDAMVDAVVGLDPETALLLVRSEGETFSAGVDVGAHRPATAPRMLERFHRLIALLLEGPAIPVAVVQGPALGGACELVTACDLVVASERATFGQPEIDVGCYPPVAAALLPETVGHRLACEMVYCGQPISAAKAATVGLVNRVAAVGRLDAEVEDLIDRLGAKSRAVLRHTREALSGPRRKGWQRRLAECERIYIEKLLCTHDAVEGVRAFRQKRPPEWRHR